MCQLTFCKFNTPELAKLFTSVSLLENTRFTHHDGWGIFAGGTVFKTDLSAQLTSNIGVLIREYHIKNSPIMSHVRLASVGSKVNFENNHPFETKHFILMHNGTLVVKKDSEEYVKTLKEHHKKETAIDSEVFAMVLESIYDKKKDVYQSLVLAMKSFQGKFAFIIYCKPENEYYVVRGKTAELHKTVFKRGNETVGFVVNTEKSTLEGSIQLFLTILQASNVILSAEEVVEVEKETVYRYYNQRLIKLGEIKEEEKPPFVNTATSWSRNGTWKSTTVNGEVAENVDLILYNKLEDFMSTYALGVEDIDRLLYFTTGKGILETTPELLRKFTNKVVPHIIVGREFRRRIKGVLSEFGLQSVPLIVYEQGNFTYPYMLIKDRHEQNKFGATLLTYVKENYAYRSK